MSATQNLSLAALLLAIGTLAACGGGGSGGGSSTTTAATTSSSSSSSSSSSGSSNSSSSSSSGSGTITSLGATGWATYSTGTTGGTGATTAKTYTVTTRKQLLDALYGGTETVATDGSYSGGTLDASAKIIYISGTISLNTNLAGTELTADNYLTYANAASTTCAGYGYTSVSTMWAAYNALFAPGVWPTGSTAAAPTGTPESVRACASAYQKKVVVLYVPSNTSIIGVGSTAKIVHGNLVLGTSSANVSNIVVRNVTFEDAYDFFPAWDPTDSTTGRWNSAYDLISVMYANNVWIDHNEFSDGTRTDDTSPSVWTGTASDNTDYATNEVYKFMHHDGLVDITKIGNYVTLSYNYFHDHDKSFLIGGTDTASLTAEHPGVLNVTFNNNYFKNLKQRQPRVRYGMVHMYNNYYEGTITTNTVYGFAVAWAAGQSARLYVENNAVALSGSASASTLFSGSSSASKTTSCAALSGMTTEYCSAYAYGTGNTLNGSAVDLSGVSTTTVTWSATPWPTKASPTASTTSTPADYYSYTAASAPTAAPTTAGVGKL